MAIDPTFEDLYLAEFRNVFATTYLLCRDADTAQEAAQEAFARALERWGRLKGQSWIGGWLTTTAMNVARRRMRREPVVAVLPVPSEPEAAIDLWRAVRTLPPREQQAVVLRYRLDLRMRDVAAAMGCEEASARTYVSRALASLRASMKDELDARA